MTKMFDSGIDPYFLNVLGERFNLLDMIQSTEFDQDPKLLVGRLQHTIKPRFDNHDRYIIVMFETDYYWHGHGICLNNIFEIWRHLNIPFYTLILYTNNLGLEHEVQELCQDLHANDRPTIIETFINPLNYQPKHYQDCVPNLDHITHHAICLMAGAKRPHRYATWTALKDIDTDRLIMSIKANAK